MTAALEPVLVVVPTYEEAGTGELADARAAVDPRVHVLHRPGKSGLGPAYVAGFRWARDHGYRIVVEMDADGSHPPERLPALLAALGDADLVLGSRWVPGGRVLDWPRYRQAISRIGNVYTRWALRLPLADATGGFRAARTDLLDRIPFEQVASQGYCFQVDWAWRASRAGARIVELPIAFSERTVGRSKMSASIVGEALARVTWWGLLDRAADWLPGRVPRPVPARDRAGRRTRALR